MRLFRKSEYRQPYVHKDCKQIPPRYRTAKAIFVSGAVAFFTLLVFWFALFSEAHQAEYIDFDKKVDVFVAPYNEIDAISLSCNDPKLKSGVESGTFDITIAITQSGEIHDILEQRTLEGITIGSWNHNNVIDLSANPIKLQKGQSYGVVVYVADGRYEDNLAVRIYGGNINFVNHYIVISLGIIFTVMVISWMILRGKILTSLGIFIAVLLIGTDIIITENPFTVPDESIHFLQAYQLSNRMLGKGKLSDEGTVEFDDRELVYLMSGENRTDGMWECLMPQPYETVIPPYTSNSYLMSTYPNVTQVFSALWITIFRLLRAPWYAVALSGKIGNLLLYAIAAGLSAAICPSIDRFILGFSLLPGCIFLGASYSYDSLLFAAGMILFSSFYEVMLNHSRRPVLRRMTMTGMVFVMTYIKPPFIMLFLLILITLQKEINKKGKIVFLGVCICLLLSVWITRGNAIGDVLNGGEIDPRAISSMDTRSPNDTRPINNFKLLQDAEPSYTEDGNEYYPYTISWCNRHPIYTTKVIINSLIDQAGINYEKMFGKAFTGRSDLEGIYLVLDTIIILSLAASLSSDFHLSNANRIITGIIAAGIILVFYMVMLLTFSSIPFDGIGIILGVQGRYFVPLMLFLPMWISNTKLFNRSQKQINNLLYLELYSELFLAALQLKAVIP